MLAKIFGRYSVWGPLIIRIGVGLTFFFAGLSKLTAIAGTVTFFRGLGLPLPELVAPFIGVVECVGGLLVLVGMFSRVANVFHIGDMLVAILVGRLPQVGQQGWVAVRVEFMLLMGSIFLLVTGAGMLSVDKNVIKKELP